MGKVGKVLLAMEKAEQIVLIDRACQQCAKLLVQKFSEVGDEEDFCRDVFELKKPQIANLVSAFSGSAFNYGAGFNVGHAFDATLYPIRAFNDVDVMRILYPVLFYTLILKNFQNKDTVGRRTRRGSKAWGNTKELLKVNPIDEQHKSKSTEDKILKILPPELVGKIQIAEQEGTYKDGAARGLDDEAEQLLMHYDVAMFYLSDHRISWVETVSRRGLFARDVLKSQMEHSSPVDTILRLYLLECIDEVVSGAGKLSNGYQMPGLPHQYLLTAFCEDREQSNRTVQEGNESAEWDNSSQEVSLDEGGDLSDDFDYLYSQLSLLTFTDEDAADMLDYFFCAGKLNWYLHMDEHIHKYAEAISDGMNRKENIDERHFELENLFAPYRMELLGSLW